MADPLSVLGAAIGVTSLIMQVTDECVKGFKLYRGTLGMPNDYRHLRLRLQVEQQRFLNFGLEAGNLFADGVLCAALQINRSLLLAVLAEIKTLLTDYANINGRYEKFVPQDDIDWLETTDPGGELMDLLCPSESIVTPNKSTVSTKKRLAHRFSKLSKSVTETGRNLRTITLEPRRLVWVAVDKDSFESLVSKVADLNTFLISLLNTSQIARLQEVTSNTYLEIIQMRNDIESLRDLVRALDAPRQNSQTSQSNASDFKIDALPQISLIDLEHERVFRNYLKKLIEVKIHYNQSNRLPAGFSQKSSTSMLELTQNDFDIQLSPKDLDSDHSSSRSMAKYKDSNFWVEWKYNPLIDNDSRSDQESTEDRIKLLTDLLRYEKPDEFRAAPCLGYIKIVVRSDFRARFGLVFERPPSVDVDCELHTLRGFLGQSPRPSLSDRIRLCTLLARSVFNFHSVGWLHKNLSSNNIIIFSSHSPAEPPHLAHAYTSGFDLARPKILDNMTEKPSFVPSEDVYRHPYAQSSQASGGAFRPSYDVYSLGIVLLEVGLWKGIDAIIGFKDIARVKPLALREIQPWLLGRPYRSSAAALYGLPDIDPATRGLKRLLSPECGDGFCRIVESCLTIDEADHAQYTGESDAAIAVRVQSIVRDDILRPLERISLVL